MPAQPVVAIPNRVLKQVAADAPPDLDRPSLAADLVESMRASPGCVGLAAPQIGRSVRAFCLDVSGHPLGSPNHGLVVLFNPRVLRSDGAEVRREGCMSVPHFTANVRRAVRVVVEGGDAGGQHRLLVTSGFEARAVQHELDHLDGLLILDRVASLSSDVFRRRTYTGPK